MSSTRSATASRCGSRSLRRCTTGSRPTSRRCSHLPRGWERQLDVAYNALFYNPGRLPPAAYRTWLLSNGVSFVALANAPLDYAATTEAALLRSGAVSGLQPCLALGELGAMERSGQPRPHQRPGPAPFPDPPVGARPDLGTRPEPAQAALVPLLVPRAHGGEGVLEPGPRRLDRAQFGRPRPRGAHLVGPSS